MTQPFSDNFSVTSDKMSDRIATIDLDLAFPHDGVGRYLMSGSSDKMTSFCLKNYLQFEIETNGDHDIPSYGIEISPTELSFVTGRRAVSGKPTTRGMV